ncbi:MAG: hypothetical protein NC429_13295 [Lachnospiraceae bacterium]|nr:hypothetical protein [Lachnospiraceae bacterium]
MADWLVAGWDFFYFVITPEELKACLKDFHLVVHNAHVPIDYVESSIDSYISIQRELFRRLSMGEKLIWKEHANLFKMIAITTEMSRCGYGNIHEYDGKLWKGANFDEPCVNLSPFILSVIRSKNGSFSINTKFSYIQNPENTVGIKLSYPKKIQYKFPDGSYEELKSTKELKSYQDFLLIKKSIEKITKPLSFWMNDKLVKPKIRISNDALENIGEFYFFKENSIVDICKQNKKERSG